ncbi:MAG: hypothetical protein MRJ68_11160 [Nitrospira sp.]|nr:hypothetical protein [Nitrospira sp.]
MILRILLTVLFGVALLTPLVAQPQQSSITNEVDLKKYFEPKSITRLEWELVTFNIRWQNAFRFDADYIDSHPVVFDAQKLRFHGRFRVAEKRYFNDPYPFFELPRFRREAILEGGVSHLKTILGQHFPELLVNPSLLYVEFQFVSSGGGSSVIARYDGGMLKLSE